MKWSEPDYEEAVSLAEGARRFQISQATLRTWIKNGKALGTRITQTRTTPQGKSFEMRIDGVYAPMWINDYESKKAESDERLRICTKRLRVAIGYMAQRFGLLDREKGWMFLVQMVDQEDGRSVIEARHLRGGRQVIIEFTNELFGHTFDFQIASIGFALATCHFESLRSQMELVVGETHPLLRSIGEVEKGVGAALLANLDMNRIAEWVSDDDDEDMVTVYPQVRLDRPVFATR